MMKQTTIFTWTHFLPILAAFATFALPVSSQAHDACYDQTVTVGGVPYKLSDLDLCKGPDELEIIGQTETNLEQLDRLTHFSGISMIPYAVIQLTDALPKDCQFIPGQDLPVGSNLQNVACSTQTSQGATTYILPSLFSQLDSTTRALLWAHESIQLNYSNQSWEFKTDITKAPCPRISSTFSTPDFSALKP